MKTKRKLWTTLIVLCLTFLYSVPVMASSPNHPNFETKQPSLDIAERRILVQSYELDNGLTCNVYEIPSLSPLASGTKTKTYDFSLSYSSVEFGYLRQITSWRYDGVNRPTLLSSSNTFYSYDPSKHYLTGRGSSTTNYDVSSTKYNRKADVYYNSNYIATTNFSTICDKNGNFSSVCVDE